MFKQFHNYLNIKVLLIKQMLCLEWKAGDGKAKNRAVGHLHLTLGCVLPSDKDGRTGFFVSHMHF